MIDKVELIKSEIERLKKPAEKRIKRDKEDCWASDIATCEVLNELENFINSLLEESGKLWHEASEEPKLNAEILVLMCDNSVKEVKTYQNDIGKNEYFDGVGFWKISEQKAWCYLTDLLAVK